MNNYAALHGLGRAPGFASPPANNPRCKWDASLGSLSGQRRKCARAAAASPRGWEPKYRTVHRPTNSPISRGHSVRKTRHDIRGLRRQGWWRRRRVADLLRRSVGWWMTMERALLMIDAVVQCSAGEGTESAAQKSSAQHISAAAIVTDNPTGEHAAGDGAALHVGTGAHATIERGGQSELRIKRTLVLMARVTVSAKKRARRAGSRPVASTEIETEGDRGLPDRLVTGVIVKGRRGRCGIHYPCRGVEIGMTLASRKSPPDTGTVIPAPT